MAIAIPNVKQRYFDANGEPLAGGKLYSYLATTSTKKSTYTTTAGDVANENPVVLDANGQADIFLGTGNYKLVLTDADDVEQWSEDNIQGEDETASPTSSWNTHDVVDGQAATALAAETVDFATYSQAVWECEIKRGTTVRTYGLVAIQSLNGTGRVVLGGILTEELHGVTFTVTQVTTVCTLNAALDSGAGNGTIKLSRRLVPV